MKPFVLRVFIGLKDLGGEVMTLNKIQGLCGRQVLRIQKQVQTLLTL
jgi:hypothetical protein